MTASHYYPQTAVQLSRTGSVPSDTTRVSPHCQDERRVKANRIKRPGADSFQRRERRASRSTANWRISPEPAFVARSSCSKDHDHCFSISLCNNNNNKINNDNNNDDACQLGSDPHDFDLKNCLNVLILGCSGRAQVAKCQVSILKSNETSKISQTNVKSMQLTSASRFTKIYMFYDLGLSMKSSSLRYIPRQTIRL